MTTLYRPLQNFHPLFSPIDSTGSQVDEEETLVMMVKEVCTLAIASLFGENPSDSILPLLLKGADVTPTTNERFGHYQFNSAMALAKVMGQPPREVAERLVEAIEKALAQSGGNKSSFSIDKIEIAGPGFINLTLHPQMVSDRVESAARSLREGVGYAKPRQRIIVEFSSPNIAKEMHVGHLRSTIIGETLARTLEFLGHDVLRLNHVGDWGTQFGMLIAWMKQDQRISTVEESVDVATLMAWYRQAKEAFDRDPVFKQQAQQEVVALQQGDRDSLKAWEAICTISRRAYQEIYDLLGITLTERGESTYNAALPEIIDDFEKKGLIVIDHGAKCLFLEGFTNREGEPLPLIVQKADGGYNYATTDLAAIRQRVEQEKADRVIYVVDAGQATHFKMIFEAARLAGYIDSSLELDHVAFGLVKGVTGKKFRTREGKTERLRDLLDEAMEQARHEVEKRLVEEEKSFSPEEIEALAKAIGLGAVKYADLSSHRIKDYVYSLERMLRFEGNTAPFLLYAYVRVMGIQRKARAALGSKLDEIVATGKVELIEPTELALGLHLARFGEVLEGVARDLTPHRLAEYLYHLAEKFNAFFRDCRVLGGDHEASRFVICEATGKVLHRGLTLLGLETVERM